MRLRLRDIGAVLPPERRNASDAHSPQLVGMNVAHVDRAGARTVLRQRLVLPSVPEFVSYGRRTLVATCHLSLPVARAHCSTAPRSNTRIPERTATGSGNDGSVRTSRSTCCRVTPSSFAISVTLISDCMRETVASAHRNPWVRCHLTPVSSDTLVSHCHKKKVPSRS